MNTISKSAVISNDAVIGENVTVGHFSIIEDGTKISDNCEIHSNVIIHKGSILNKNVKVFSGAIIGNNPLDLKFEGEETTLEIGENTIVREYATISKGTKARKQTIIGKNCFIMSYVHVAHDTIIGNNVILANSVNMGGHVEIDDWAIVGGMTGIHQFVKIGCHSFIAFSSRVTQDIPPYVLAGGEPLSYKGLNIVGLKRRGFSDETISAIKTAYSYIYGKTYNTKEALNVIKESLQLTDEIKNIINFIESSDRGILKKSSNNNYE